MNKHNYQSYKQMEGFYKLTKEEKLEQRQEDLNILVQAKKELEQIKAYSELYQLAQGVQKEIMFDAINMHILTFCEYTVKVSNPFQWTNFNTTALPWAALRKLRNILSHYYYLMNDDIVNLFIEFTDQFDTNIGKILKKYT